MNDLQIYLTLGIFATVILVIALDLLDMTVTARLGVCALLAFGLLDIRVMLRKSLAYTAITVLITVVYALAIALANV